MQNKMKATNLKRYGVENALQNEKIKEKQKQTNLKKYGVECVMQNEEVKNKIKQTMLKKHGVEHPIQNKEIHDRIKATCKERYGVENAMQNEKIKNKVFDSLQFNGTGPSSRAQRYICHLLNGILNKNMCGSLVDIYMEKENIIIEHDGSGHFLRDRMNGHASPTEESLLYEKQREDNIINNGHKMIRFIAIKDRIPSDEVILNLVDKFKNLDFKVIRIDFEEGTIEKDYNKTMIYNFGKLRRITKKDLEPFEKQKEKNTSKTLKN